MIKLILFILALSTLHSSKGDLSVMTSYPVNKEKNASEYVLTEFSIEQDGQSQEGTRVSFNQQVINGTGASTQLVIENNNVTKVKTQIRPQIVVQKIAEQQGEGNYNQNINLHGNVGHVYIKSVGQSTSAKKHNLNINFSG